MVVLPRECKTQQTRSGPPGPGLAGYRPGAPQPGPPRLTGRAGQRPSAGLGCGDAWRGWPASADPRPTLLQRPGRGPGRRLWPGLSPWRLPARGAGERRDRRLRSEGMTPSRQWSAQPRTQRMRLVFQQSSTPGQDSRQGRRSPSGAVKALGQPAFRVGAARWPLSLRGD